MTCTACSFDNARQSVLCQGCETRRAALGFDRDRLARLAQRLHLAGAPPAGRVTMTPDFGPAVDIGPVRLVFGDPDGARIEAAGALTPASEPRPNEALRNPPRVDVRPAVTAAVWAALDSGGSIVRIDGPPGAGATTLLTRLAAEASVHGLSQAVLLTGARGPAGDVIQRLASLPNVAHAQDARALILFDRSELNSTDMIELQAIFPAFRFVVVTAFALEGAPTVTLGPLEPALLLKLIENGYERDIDENNRGVALKLCSTIDALPMFIRLTGVATRELRRSFISLHVESHSGQTAIAEFIATLPATERRILALLALVCGPLAAHHIAYVVRSGDIRAHLQRLVQYGIIDVCGAELYELPSSIVPFVAPHHHVDTAVTRTVDVICDTLDSAVSVPILDRQLLAAESLLLEAVERSQWSSVLSLAPRLAQLLAQRRALGAWGRVLGMLETAAGETGNLTARGLARHELGLHALLVGKNAEATAYFDSAIRDRQTAGNERGTLASAAARALVADDVQPPPQAEVTAPQPTQTTPLAEANFVARKAPKLLGARTLLLLAFGAFALAFIAVALRDQVIVTPAFREFSVSPATSTFATAALCVEATDAAVVEIFPNAARLPGTGRHCLNVHPTAATTYMAVATAADGQQVHRAVRVATQDIERPQPPRITAFSITPERIKTGQSARLCYAVTDAHLLRIVPRIGTLTRLRSCQTLTLRTAHRYRYALSAAGENGQIATSRAHVDVVDEPAPRVIAVRKPPEQRPTRRAVYQFDVTPASIERGQTTSLCVGVERPAQGYVTHVGALTAGITRCYRVQPPKTTIYRLYVAIHDATTMESVTVAVRSPAHFRDVARDEHR